MAKIKFVFSVCSVVDDESGIVSGGVWFAGYFPKILDHIMTEHFNLMLSNKMRMTCLHLV